MDLSAAGLLADAHACVIDRAAAAMLFDSDGTTQPVDFGIGRLSAGKVSQTDCTGTAPGSSATSPPSRTPCKPVTRACSTISPTTLFESAATVAVRGQGHPRRTKLHVLTGRLTEDPPRLDALRRRC